MSPDRLVAALTLPTCFAALLGGTLLVCAVWEASAPSFPAARVGGGRIGTNMALGVLWLLASALVPATLTSLAANAQARHVGLLPWIGVDGWPGFAVSLLILDAGQYALHRLSHRWSLLWRLHRVHHSDVAVDISTAFRHHPGDLLAALAFSALVTLLFGLSPAAIPTYGLVVLLLAIPQHADLALGERAEAILSRVVATPGLHHVHHGARIADTDTNYGEVLVIWDQLFGTLRRRSAEQRRVMPIGLGEPHDAVAGSLSGQLVAPFR